MSNPVYRLIVNCEHGEDLAMIVGELGALVEAAIVNHELVGDVQCAAETVIPFDVEDGG